jgi:hypothetical protein
VPDSRTNFASSNRDEVERTLAQHPLRFLAAAAADHLDAGQLVFQHATDQLTHHARTVDHQYPRRLGQQTAADVCTHASLIPLTGGVPCQVNLHARALRAFSLDDARRQA